MDLQKNIHVISYILIFSRQKYTSICRRGTLKHNSTRADLSAAQKRQHKHDREQ